MKCGNERKYWNKIRLNPFPFSISFMILNAESSLLIIIIMPGVEISSYLGGGQEMLNNNQCFHLQCPNMGAGCVWLRSVMAGLYNLIMPPIIHYLYSPGEVRAVRLMCNYDGPGLTSLHSTRHKPITLYTLYCLLYTPARSKLAAGITGDSLV